MRGDMRAVAAEAVGVFFMVVVGGGAILGGGNALTVALAFAFVVAAMIYALGHVSGAHFNPAITLAFAVTRHFPWRLVPLYAAAQVGAAAVAALALRMVFPSVDAAASHVRYGLDLPAAVLVEVLASAMLAFVILAVATDRRASPGFAGLAIGFAVGVGAMWAGPLTGGSMNPARSLGPALVGGEWADLWLWLTAPFAGAVLGMLAYDLLRSGAKPRHAGREAPGALGAVEES